MNHEEVNIPNINPGEVIIPFVALMFEVLLLIAG